MAKLYFLIQELVSSIIFSLCICACCIYAIAANNLDGYIEYVLGFAGYLGFGLFFLYPLIVILSFFKKLLKSLKYIYLSFGLLCILSGIITILFYLFNFELDSIKYYSQFHTPKVLSINDFVFLLILPIWGIGRLIRFLCINKYNTAFYASLKYTDYHKEIVKKYSLWELRYINYSLYIPLFIILFALANL